jgi:hypothetical protein
MIDSLLKIVQGWVKIKGNTDGTFIGNNGNRLLADVDFKNNHITSFGGLKVAEPETEFEAIYNFDKLPLVFDETIVTGGTSTWNSNTNTVDTTTNTANLASVIRQGKRRVRYNPSRSVAVQISANIGGTKANVRRRLGQFDANNGLFFELDGTTMKVVVRSNTSGSTVDTAISQSSWNKDKLDGTGSSALTLDFSKHQLYIIEYGWQGIGSIRFGFYLNGEIIYCHQVDSSNNLTAPYMKTANLPLRTEITNTSITASNTTMSVNCMVVKNFGKANAREGTTRSFYITTLKSVAALTPTPVISIRLSSTNIDGIVDVVKTVIYTQSNDDVVWQLILNPTLTGSTFANSGGYVELDTAATALTGGTILDSGFLRQGENSQLSSSDLLKQVSSFLGSTIDGTADIITLSASSRTTPADVLGSITWREF